MRDYYITEQLPTSKTDVNTIDVNIPDENKTNTVNNINTNDSKSHNNTKTTANHNYNNNKIGVDIKKDMNATDNNSVNAKKIKKNNTNDANVLQMRAADNVSINLSRY